MLLPIFVPFLGTDIFSLGRLAILSSTESGQFITVGNEQEASASMVFYILAIGISYH